MASTYKLVTFNINGLRARQHQIEELIRSQAPDIIGLQEIKCPDDQFPSDAIQTTGYHAAYFGQKSHYGVAFLSKQAPLNIETGFPGDAEDAQRRIIIGTWALANGQQLHVINGYFPQGDSRNHPTKFPAKQKFYVDLQNLLETRYQPGDKLVIMGDFNISPDDNDIGIGDDSAKRWLRQGKCSFLPEERQWYQRLYDWGLNDGYRHFYPHANEQFSWFDYRSRGFDTEPQRGLRIDHLLVTPALVPHLSGAGIDYAIRAMDKPSDHAPAWITFAFD